MYLSPGYGSCLRPTGSLLPGLSCDGSHCQPSQYEAACPCYQPDTGAQSGRLNDEAVLVTKTYCFRRKVLQKPQIADELRGESWVADPLSAAVVDDVCERGVRIDAQRTLPRVLQLYATTKLHSHTPFMHLASICGTKPQAGRSMSGLYCLLRAARQSQASKSLATHTWCALPSSLQAQVPATVASRRLLTSGSLPLCSPVHIEDEPFCRQRQLITLGNRVRH